MRLPETQLPLFPIFPILDSPTTLKFVKDWQHYIHLTSLVFQVSMGGGDCLPSGNRTLYAFLSVGTVGKRELNSRSIEGSP
uniref:SFRICE_009436 n=1 Tax=Spodoptera frugiperda TaxID=7108 RepID=A0A2H1VPH3_SPOFR